MAQTIKLKRSAVAAKIPLTTDIALGELAINTYDGKMYFKKAVGANESIIQLANDSEVVKLTGDQTIAGTKTFSGSGSSPYGSTRFYTVVNTYPPNTSFSFLAGVGIQTQQIWLGTGVTTYSTLNESGIFTTGKMSQNGTPTANADLVPLGHLNTQLATKANTGHTHTLADITNVVITSPSNGQVLKYNGTSWINGTDETGGGGVSTAYDFGTITSPVDFTLDLGAI